MYHLTISLGARWEWLTPRCSRFTPLERRLVPIEYETGWAPQVCLDHLEREESQSPGSSSPQCTLYIYYDIPAPIEVFVQLGYGNVSLDVFLFKGQVPYRDRIWKIMKHLLFKL